MEPVYLKQSTTYEPLGIKADGNSPFSFLEWKQRRPGIAERDTYFHYNNYVLTWFANNKTQTVSNKFLIRQKYLYLLTQLQLFFSDEEKNIWYEKINLSDEKELLLAIPYFAKKLKDVSVYYLKLRSRLKNVKAKYNAVGSAISIEQEVRKLLLETFSSLNKELPVSVLNTIPDFSEMQQTLVVETEEIYDDHQYFDRSPLVPASEYFDIFNNVTAQYYQTKGITLSSSDWLFDSFVVETSANFETIQNELTSVVLEFSDAAQYSSFIQKYLAESKYSITITPPPPIIEITDVDISSGDNFFYYPYGVIDNTLTFSRRLNPVALSSLNVESATAGSSLETSDTIFVKNGSDTQAAWFHYQEYEQTDKTIKSSFKGNTTTSFVFPYPGYGLSSSESSWTGAGIETTKSYEFLSKEVKSAINEAYWSQDIGQDSIEPLLINNTALVSSGANPSFSPTESDEIYIGEFNPTSTLTPRGSVSGIWLREFKTTSIPVAPEQDNVILWPYDLINAQDPLPVHLKKHSYGDVCNSVFVDELNSSRFIGASSFEYSDKIYKLENVSDEVAAAIECSWLYAEPIQSGRVKYFQQDGVSIKLESGTVTKFVWVGPTMTINNGFKFINHQQDCPFVTNNPAVSAFEWQKCSCKQVYYSPFGHPGTTFDEYNKHSDYICEGNLETEQFDLASWVDEDGNNYLTSALFSWYQTKENKQGWEMGDWKQASGSQSTMLLIPGRVYFYFRASSKFESEKFPPLISLVSTENRNTKWKQARKNENGDWISSNVDSTMIISPGDIIKIERANNTWFGLSSSFVEDTSVNKGSEWSSLDYIALGSEISTASISWPFDSVGTSQSPPVPFSKLAGIVSWKIESVQDPSKYIILDSSYTDTETTKLLLEENPAVISSSNELTAVQTTTRTYTDGAFFTFTPNMTGTYAVSVTAIGLDSTLYYLNSSTIPLLSVVPLYKENLTEVSFDFPSSGFLLEQPLSGWAYSDGSQGAKPYWAELYTNKGTATKQKGTYSWGYPNEYVDSYLPHNIPKISNIELKYGSSIEYRRKKDLFHWIQPVQYNTFVDKRQWNKISITESVNSNLSSLFESQLLNTIEVIPTFSATDILLTNNINGLPVEIYYHALNSFVWPISVEITDVSLDSRISSPEVKYQSQEPWANLGNRFFPTIAVAPVLEKIYTEEDVGGYFTPNSLGASQFVNQNFSVSLKDTNLSGTFLTQDTSVHVGGRGHTKRDQNTLYDWEERNEWMKEPFTSEKLAGAVKKPLTKELQTFIPYQANSAETALGLVTPSSRVSPWGGTNADIWTDSLNEPKGFTGVRNVPAWAETQVLKQNEKWIDCWTTDIFGNQYGIFKDLNDVSVKDRKDVGGELWTRTNDQVVLPARTSLFDTFDLFKSDPLFYSELTGSGIKSVDCFFNMLMLETSLSTVFVQVDYDYDSKKINTVFDNIIKEGNTSQRRFEQTWFFPQTKRVVSLFTNLSGSGFYPELTELDLNTRTYKRIFPENQKIAEQITSYCGIGDIKIQSLDRGCLHHNKIQKSYLMTYKGVDIHNKLFIVNFLAEEQKNVILKDITAYLDTSNSALVQNPPIVSSEFFDTFVVPVCSTGSLSVTASNNPTGFELLNHTQTVSSDNNGTFFYYFPLAGLYHVNYEVSNSIGSNQFCLTLSAI